MKRKHTEKKSANRQKRKFNISNCNRIAYGPELIDRVKLGKQLPRTSNR